MPTTTALAQPDACGHLSFSIFSVMSLSQKQSVENITAFRSKIRNHSAD